MYVYIWWNSNHITIKKKMFKICVWSVFQGSVGCDSGLAFPRRAVQEKIQHQGHGFDSLQWSVREQHWVARTTLHLKNILNVKIFGADAAVFFIFNRPRPLNCLFSWALNIWSTTSACLQFFSWGFPPGRSSPLQSLITSTPALMANEWDTDIHL